MRLALRRGVVAAVERSPGAVAELTVSVGGADRAAIAYRDLTGDVEPGDEVVVNTCALDLELGSGGFDIVHVNLTRGIDAEVDPRARRMKLNYTPLQHGVRPVEEAAAGCDREPGAAERPVAVLALHGQLEPVAWAAAQRAPREQVGYIQTGGGALAGGLSRAARELRRRGLIAGHITAAPAFGGEHEALTLAGALEAAFGSLAWSAALVGPGPGIVGSGTTLGHGGLAALDSAHVSLALGSPTLLVPRMSSADPRSRHRGLSHHSATVLGLLLARAVVAVPAEAPDTLARSDALERHEIRATSTDLDAYRAAGLSSRTMGRTIDEDELFFRAALAGGTVLGEELTRHAPEAEDL